jgi:hypothetical protein
LYAKGDHGGSDGEEGDGGDIEGLIDHGQGDIDSTRFALFGLDAARRAAATELHEKEYADAMARAKRGDGEAWRGVSHAYSHGDADRRAEWDQRLVEELADIRARRCPRDREAPVTRAHKELSDIDVYKNDLELDFCGRKGHTGGCQCHITNARESIERWANSAEKQDDWAAEMEKWTQTMSGEELREACFHMGIVGGRGGVTPKYTKGEMIAKLTDWCPIRVEEAALSEVIALNRLIAGCSVMVKGHDSDSDDERDVREDHPPKREAPVTRAHPGRKRAKELERGGGRGGIWVRPEKPGFVCGVVKVTSMIGRGPNSGGGIGGLNGWPNETFTMREELLKSLDGELLEWRAGLGRTTLLKWRATVTKLLETCCPGKKWKAEGDPSSTYWSWDRWQLVRPL